MAVSFLTFFYWRPMAICTIGWIRFKWRQYEVHQNQYEFIRENMSPYEKHKNYKFKALRGKIEKSATVKGPIILTFITDFLNNKIWRCPLSELNNERDEFLWNNQKRRKLKKNSIVQKTFDTNQRCFLILSSFYKSNIEGRLQTYFLFQKSVMKVKIMGPFTVSLFSILPLWALNL